MKKYIHRDGWNNEYLSHITIDEDNVLLCHYKNGETSPAKYIDVVTAEIFIREGLWVEMKEEV